MNTVSSILCICLYDAKNSSSSLSYKYLYHVPIQTKQTLFVFNQLEVNSKLVSKNITMHKTFSIALLNLPVIFLHTLAAKVFEPNGSSEITVFRPMLLISRSCSVSESMLAQRVSTILST